MCQHPLAFSFLCESNFSNPNLSLFLEAHLFTPERILKLFIILLFFPLLDLTGLSLVTITILGKSRSVQVSRKSCEITAGINTQTSETIIIIS